MVDVVLWSFLGGLAGGSAVSVLKLWLGSRGDS
jgi:hypothetical protein